MLGKNKRLWNRHPGVYGGLVFNLGRSICVLMSMMPKLSKAKANATMRTNRVACAKMLVTSGVSTTTNVNAVKMKVTIRASIVKLVARLCT